MLSKLKNLFKEAIDAVDSGKSLAEKTKILSVHFGKCFKHYVPFNPEHIAYLPYLYPSDYEKAREFLGQNQFLPVHRFRFIPFYDHYADSILSAQAIEKMDYLAGKYLLRKLAELTTHDETEDGTKIPETLLFDLDPDEPLDDLIEDTTDEMDVFLYANGFSIVCQKGNLEFRLCKNIDERDAMKASFIFNDLYLAGHLVKPRRAVERLLSKPLR